MSKHIAIIGGTSGIGRAVIAQLQADGHHVHAACRSPEKLADLDIVAQSFDAAAPGPLTWSAPDHPVVPVGVVRYHHNIDP